MQVLLFLVVGLVNFAWLAMCGMYHVGMFVLFVLVVIGAACSRK